MIRSIPSLLLRKRAAATVVGNGGSHTLSQMSSSSVNRCAPSDRSIIDRSRYYAGVSLFAQPNRNMTTAYQGIPGDGKHNSHLISDLIPFRATLNDGRRVEVDYFRHDEDIEEDEYFAGYALMNLIIREGRSWPFDQEFATVDDWRGYFLSHTAFVVRAINNGIDSSKNRNSSSAGEILGCFYIKPNFPGRCSHICNGGFITAPRFRRIGVGRLMGRVFLRAARDLGYKSSYFNLVFKSNKGSVLMWESLGFQRVSVLENAADLEGLQKLDTAYGYRYDLEKLPDNYRP
jgi:GNAT superfamily N-acetyltransferase